MAQLISSNFKKLLRLLAYASFEAKLKHLANDEKLKIVGKT
jgi:hypothetical protein